jgi:menaquinone-dependent protoporphyrinogen oxidase
MPRVLVVYGTTDGHTRKVAEALRTALGDEACAVDVVDARGRSATNPAAYDGVIVAASIHAGGYQRAVRRWVGLHAETLNRKPGAFVSVCLAVLEKRPEAHQKVEAIMQRFLTDGGWRPAIRKAVAGALPYTRYNWFKKWIMKRIVAKGGGDTDTTRDFEYTDWDDVRAFGREFARRIGVGHGIGAVP